MAKKGDIEVDLRTSQLMDWLRGLSALIVAYVHGFQIFVLPYFGAGTPSHVLTSLIATYAVNTFFVVSGFMICISTLRHRNLDGSFRSAEFAKARVIRIYPPLLLAVAVTLLVYFVISGLGLHGSESFRLGGELLLVRERIQVEWTALPSTLLLLYGAVPSVPPPINMDGPLWTLSYEWWFYVSTFLIARLWNGLSFSRVVPIALLLGMLIYGRNSLFLWFLLIWLGGFCLAIAYVGHWLHTKYFFPVVVALAGILLIALFVIGNGHLWSDILLPFDSSSAQKIMVVNSMLATLVLSGVVRRVSISRHEFARPATRLASFSYTLYVIHYPLFLLAFSLLHLLLHNFNWMVSLSTATLVLILITYTSSRAAKVVEDRKLLRHMASRLLSN
ncbi:MULTISPECIES: acyltransferase [unclassified Bradyrhizobium]|uniref:acyltransferase family protein n=1 Tax=unclassified Bradyrhizobium TaxID=2631580 RepID=UPI001FF9A853|nr:MULTISPECIES: acyltransferase [unclassified Bradyrhizobium]MCK1577685.1 acyltransferase [Bradyrhizobium sp. 174]UPJ29863.1 acyltransferase [Bradyrhizobium sp. CW1]UPJ82769.1 acyltransferase [Bradyrhizobium sp. 184]UPJ90561.1 acyltransferase [Bradyrhizobium sp. 183]